MISSTSKIVSALALSFGILHSATAAESRPNVIFILADDLGWSDTTLNGTTKFYQTPNLERLAKRGMVFSRAYSASPLCSPTRASILTGLNPARIGITAPNCHLPEVKLTASVQESAPPTIKALQCESATRLDPKYCTLAEALKSNGYATGHFGKWHLGSEPYSPLQHGFDVDLPHTPGPGPAGSFVAPWKFKDFDPLTPNEHIEDRMANEAVAWMEKQKDRPFFLNYWQFSVHAPFDAKKALIEKHRSRVNPADPQRSPTYAAMVESMDDSIGKLLDAVDRLGIADRTAIIFISDNGGNMYNTVDGTTPTSNVPLRGGKATMYEGGIRVPCVVSWPRVTKPGSRSDSPLQTTDFYPTILELLQLQPQPGQSFDGISIAPSLRGETQSRGALYTYFPHSPKVPDHLPPAVSIVEGDWKLIRLFHEGDQGAHAYQLYDLKADIGEKTDLSAAQPDRVKSMDAKLETFLKETHAVLPKPNPAYRANAKATAATPADPLEGWKARGCEASVKDGIVTLKPQGKEPFFAISAGKHAGATKVKFRYRLANAGSGKIEWLPTPAAKDKAQSVAVEFSGDDWKEAAIDLPAQGAVGILRIYFPPVAANVEIDWIEIISKTTSSRTNF